MTPLIFGSNNLQKLKEVQSILNNQFSLLSLQDAGIDFDIPEPFDTIHENACEKARVVYSHTAMDCFSEDTGLEVESLNGAPGVRSARYAGEQASTQDNIDLLLSRMQDSKERQARFKTVVCLIVNGEEFTFEGICEGHITSEPKGDSGFGYDPVFIPNGSEKTFAEMTLEEKNTFSHRKKAMDKLAAFLQSQDTNL